MFFYLKGGIELGAITLKQAKAHLDLWLEAEMAVATGQSYTIGTRSLTRANLFQIREEIKMWEQKVEGLEAIELRKGKRRVMRVVPRDL